MDDYIRVHADDLAGIIRAGMEARADLETCIRNATEAAAQWQVEIDEVLAQFNRFRRGVQEATGLDQVELLHDDELVQRVRHDALRSMIRLTDPINQTQPGPFTRAYEAAGYSMPEPQAVEQRASVVPMYDDFQRTGFAQQHDTDETAFPESGEQDGPPAVADIKHAHDAQRRYRQSGYVLGCGVHGAHPHGEHYCDVCTLCRPVEVDEQAERLAAWEADQRPGEQAVHLPGQSGALPDDGPATESMPAVEEPPAVPDGFAIGRVFTRGDSFPDDVSGWWGITTRTGDVWELLKFVSDMAILSCSPLDMTYTWAELLHMHGTVWELVMVDDRRAFEWINAWREQPSVAEQALVDDEAARDE